jgi:VanZ like family
LTFALRLLTYYCSIQLAIGDFLVQQRFRKLLMHALTWQLALASYWLALFVMTHVPIDVVALPGNSIDKLVHVSAFAILAMLLAIAWHLSAGPLTWRHFACAWVLLVLYGAMDEWTQTYVGRIASFADWLGDALGAFIGLATFAALNWLVAGKSQQAERGETVNQ